MTLRTDIFLYTEKLSYQLAEILWAKFTTLWGGESGGATLLVVTGKAWNQLLQPLLLPVASFASYLEVWGKVFHLWWLTHCSALVVTGKA